MEHKNTTFEFYDNAILGKLMTVATLFAFILLFSVIFSEERKDTETLVFVIIFIAIISIITILINRNWPKKIKIVGKKIEITCNWRKIKMPVKSIDITISSNLKKYSQNIQKFTGFNIIEKENNKRNFRIRCFMLRSYKEAENCYEILKRMTK